MGGWKLRLHFFPLHVDVSSHRPRPICTNSTTSPLFIRVNIREWIDTISAVLYTKSPSHPLVINISKEAGWAQTPSTPQSHSKSQVWGESTHAITNRITNSSNSRPLSHHRHTQNLHRKMHPTKLLLSKGLFFSLP